MCRLRRFLRTSKPTNRRPLLGPVLVATFLAAMLSAGCAPSLSTSGATRSMTISGNSMEAAFHGTRSTFDCPACRQPGYLALIEGEDSLSSTCPFCGKRIELQPKVAGDFVRVAPITSAFQLKRFDCVVVHVPSTPRAEVKRLVGFPHESLTFVEGEMFVDGLRFQKTLPQFMHQSIPVKRWLAIEKMLTSSDGQLAYEHLSLWPRRTEALEAHPSPILDEYPMCPHESRWPIPVHDIGLRLSFRAAPEADTEVCIAIYDRIHQQRAIWVRWSDFCALDRRRIRRSDMASNGVELDGSHGPTTLLVANVDGRLLAGDLNDWVELDGRTPTAPKCTATSPLALRVERGALSVLNAEIVRDIHYRGPGDESEFALPGVLGYHLLGDNVAESLDSRHRWPNGVSPEYLIGVVNASGAVPP